MKYESARVESELRIARNRRWIIAVMLANQLFSPPCILIGMHRSGTSMLSSLLHACGVFMGNDWDQHHESIYFRRINENLLADQGSDWVLPKCPDSSRLPNLSTAGMIRQYIKPHRDPTALVNLLRGGSWGWKDPRNTFTLDCWLRIFPNAKVIHIFRNGMDVALSLYQRSLQKDAGGNRHSQFRDKTAGLALWERYVQQAFSHQARLGDRMVTLQFEKLIAGDGQEIRKLEQFTGLALRERINAMADKGCHSRFVGHPDLIQLAGKSSWMQRLGYC
jgi:hypothetical protein